MRAHRDAFKKASASSGYDEVCERSNEIFANIWKIAHTIVAKSAHTQNGLLIQAVAALTVDETFEGDTKEQVDDLRGVTPAAIALWQIASHLGFAVPAWVNDNPNQHLLRLTENVYDEA
jgi:hypothetical protein